MFGGGGSPWGGNQFGGGNPFGGFGGGMNPFGGFGGNQFGGFGGNPWAPRPRPRPRHRSEVVHIVKALPPGSTVNVERININKARPFYG